MVQYGHGDEAVPTDPASYVQARLRRLPSFARELIAGGCAGGLAKTCMAPLERTKIIFQTRGSAGMTVGGVLTQIWQQEGLHGLFRGNTASVMRIVPYAAIHFGLYEYYRRGIISLVIPDSQPGSREQGTPIWDLLAGSASGATAVLATYPLDLIRTRLAWATEAPSAERGPPLHHGIWSQLKTSVSEEGFIGLYRGCTPTLLGILPYAGLKFYVYQALKYEYRAYIASQPYQDLPGQAASNNSPAALEVTAKAAATASVQSSGVGSVTSALQNEVMHQQGQQQEASLQTPTAAGQKLPIVVTLVFGGVAGLAAQTVTYPLDVIRRQMQVAHLKHSAAAQQTCQTTTNSNSGSASSTGPSHSQAAQTLVSAQQQKAGMSQESSMSAKTAATMSSEPSSSSFSNNRKVWQQQQSSVVYPRQCIAQGMNTALSGENRQQLHRQQCERPQLVQTLNKTLGDYSLGFRQCASTATASDPNGRMAHSQRMIHEALRPSMRKVAQKLWTEGGIKAFFRGLSINYLKVVPSTAVGFTVYDVLKSYLGLTSTL